MFQLDIRDNIAEVLRRVDARQKSIPVATSNALNLAANKVRDQEISTMQRVFDRPTRYTLNSLFVTRASVADLRARVFLKERWSGKHYLRPEIYGGGRLPKGFELMLRQAGHLPDGMYAVPGGGAKIDAYGNMSRGQLLQVMSYLRLAERTSGYTANRPHGKRRGRKRPEFFVGRPGDGRLPLGVWQSFRFGMGSAVKPILIFVKQPQYQARFHFHKVAHEVARKAFPLFFERELRGIKTGLSLGMTRWSDYG